MTNLKNSLKIFFPILFLTLIFTCGFSENVNAAAPQTQVQTLKKGKTCQVTGYYQVISSNESVATAEKASSKNYTVTALKKGKATLECYDKKGELKKEIYLLSTTDQSFAYNESSLLLTTGDSKKVAASTNFNSGVTIKYVSSDKEIATVDANGKIKAVAPGTATIKAKFYYKNTRVKTIKKEVNVYSCSYDTTALVLTEGDTQKVKAAVSEGCTVEYSSSDKSVAKVNKNGKITAVNAGTASLSVQVYYGDKNVQTMKKTVTVKAKRGPEDPIRVLFVGNSKTHTFDIPGCFAEIAEAMGENVEVNSVTEGGQTLLYIAENKKAEIKAQDYDYVVLQEHTSNITNYSEYLSGAKKIAKYVRQNNPDVQMVVRACWVRSTSSQKTRMKAYENSEKVAAKIGAIVVNDGQAFDLCTETYPNIPLYKDGIHPSKQGAYLSACCAYATIFGESPVGCSYAGNITSQTRVKRLQTIAERVSF